MNRHKRRSRPLTPGCRRCSAQQARVYLVGLIERRDRTVAHMRVDSFAVLVVYLGGLVMLYQLR